MTISDKKAIFSLLNSVVNFTQSPFLGSKILLLMKSFIDENNIESMGFSLEDSIPQKLNNLNPNIYAGV